MATASLTLNTTGITITSSSLKGVVLSSGYNQLYGQIMYNCGREYNEQWGSITASLPQNLRSNITVTSININLNAGTPTRSAAKSGYSYDKNVIKEINSGQRTSFPIYFYYQATAEEATLPYNTYQSWLAAGAQKHRQSWSNVSCTITYTCNTQYSFDKTSVADGEDLTLTLTLAPSENIPAHQLSAKVFDANNNVIMEFTDLNNEALTKGVTYTFRKTITYNGGTISGTKRIVFYNGSTQIGDSITVNNIVCVAQRTAPQVNDITSGTKISFDKSIYWSGLDKPVFTCGRIIIDPNVPDANIVTARIIFTHSAINSIDLNTTLISTNGNTTWELTPLIINSTFAEDTLSTGYMLHLVDAYDNYIDITPIDINTNEPVQLTINKYNTPSIESDFVIQRYMASVVDPDVKEAAAEGQELWVNGTIIYDSRIPTYLSFTYVDENGVEQTINPTAITNDGQYANDTSFFAGKTFQADLDYTIYVTLKDTYTTITKEIEIGRAVGYLNVEQGGVAIGGIAHGTLQDKRFECYYPMYLVFGTKKYPVERYISGGHTYLVLNEARAEDTDIHVISTSRILLTSWNEDRNLGTLAVADGGIKWTMQDFQCLWKVDNSLFVKPYAAVKEYNASMNSSSSNHTGAIIMKKDGSSNREMICIRMGTMEIPEGYNNLNLQFCWDDGAAEIGFGIVRSTYKITRMFESFSGSATTGVRAIRTKVIGTDSNKFWYTITLNISNLTKNLDWTPAIVYDGGTTGTYSIPIIVSRVYFS